MSELILHHYPASPFAEKTRLMLGFKGLSWRSVLIPPMLPKPDLVPLTGGYRKTPVLQIGADIYCDTALIARRLEQQKAQPALFPAGQEMITATFAAWLDSFAFANCVALIFQPESAAVRFARFSPEARQAFIEDRMKLFSGGSAVRVAVEQAKQQWPVIMARLEQQLQREAGDYLFGEPSIADFSMAHLCWFLKGTPVTAPLVDAYPAVSAWFARVQGFGHGASSELSAEQALDIARDATPAPLPAEPFDDPNGFKAGDQVKIAAVDYGVDAVEGELVYAGGEAFILKRQDDRVGMVHVHFPRLGFRVEKC
jgi:glutathione S-transferase